MASASTSSEGSSNAVRVFDLQGWLGKEGGSIKTWKKRWCVLEKGTLYYFKSPDNVHGADFPRANGSLRVLGCQVGEENYKKKKNGFFIVTENRIFHFSAPTSEDRAAWLRTLKEADIMEQPRIEAEQNLVSLKCAVVGPSYSGKSCLIRNWTGEGPFSSEYIESQIPDSSQKVAPLDGGMGCLMEIWEVPGSVNLSSFPDVVAQSLKALLVCFEITQSTSFSSAKKSVRTLRTLFPDLPLTLVGCKADLKSRRQVSLEVAHTFAEEMGCPYLEVSSKSDALVAQLFESLLEVLYRNGVLLHRPVFSR